MRPAVRSGRCSPRTGWRRGRRTLVGASSSSPPAADHVFDTLGATWWIDAAQEVTDGATSACQWALNRGNQAVPHARLGSTGRAELRGSYGLVLPGVSGNYASAPDSAALDGFATLDLVAQIAMDDWTPSSPQYVITKYGSTTRSYIFGFNTGGVLRCLVSENGTATMGGDSTVATAFTDGQIGWIRVLVTPGVTNGTMKFYTSTDGATWTQLGSDVSAAGYNTQLANSSDPLNIGGHTNGTTHLMVGRVFRAQVWNGDSTSGGTKVFDADFTAPAAFATSFTESSSNAATVTINATSGADTNDPLLLPHTGTNYLYLPGSGANYASTPDAAVLDGFDDLEIIARVAAADWTPAGRSLVLGKRKGDSSDMSYAFGITSGGNMYLLVADGAASFTEATSTVATGFTDGATYWIRATRTKSTGTVQFFHAADQATVPSSWTQLGSDRTGGVTGTIKNSAYALAVGGYIDGSLSEPWTGSIYRTIVRNGIGGTAVFDADFTTNTNQSSFTESSSNAATVTINRATSGRKAVMVTRPVWLFGTDDYMEVADNDLLDFNNEDFTICAVVRVNPNVPANGRIISKRDGTSPNYGWDLLGDATVSAVDFYGLVDSVSGNTAVSPGTPADIDPIPLQLSLLGFMVDVTAGELRGFLGSTLESARTLLASRDYRNSRPMSIGRLDGGGSGYFDGEMVAAAVFRSKLTTDDLADIASYFGV